MAFILVHMEDFNWSTEEYHATNSHTMKDYLNNYLPNRFKVSFEDGSYAEITNKSNGLVWGVHAGGNGNSFSHKVRFGRLL